MSKTKVQVTPKGQYTITIPRPLAQARGLKHGSIAEWRINREGKLELTL